MIFTILLILSVALWGVTPLVLFLMIFTLPIDFVLWALAISGFIAKIL